MEKEPVNNKTGEVLGTDLALPSREEMLEMRLKIREKLVPKDNRVTNQPFLRVKWIPDKKTGNPYFYLVQHVVEDGKRRLKTLKYYGKTRPTMRQINANIK